MRTDTGQSLQPLGAAQALIAAIETLAARDSNAVLEVIPDEAPLETNRHYPAQPLCFGGGNWRAYYHCHPYPERDEAEHGHFHLFMRPQGDTDHQDAWCHVAALSMDRDGQPIAWLALNRWVAGGPWFAARTLAACLQASARPRAFAPAEAFLDAMRAFYRDDLVALLRERDAQLRRVAGGDIAVAIDDRRHYVLAHRAVLLLPRLEHALRARH